MNIAIFSPNQNPYSETFIQAHKQYLKGKVFYYYGTGSHIKLEGQERLMPVYLYKFLRIYAKLFGKSSTYVWQQLVHYSLKTNKIAIVLVEYGNHAHHLKTVLKASGLPFVVHFHGYDASITNVLERCNYYKSVFEEASKIIAVSKPMENALLEMGCPKDKLVYNVYGPRPEFHEVAPTYRNPQFIGIGRFTDKKAPYYTIMAFKQVLETHPDARLLMAGDGELLNMCKNLVQYYGLEHQVLFLGIITAERYRELLSESLAFVQHSITAANGDMEGTPLAILEASAAGLPVIATRHAGIPDVIVDGETGLLCDEHDVKAMSNNMLTLLNDVDLAKKLGASGKKRIMANYTLENHLNKLQNILDEVVNKS